MLGAYFSLLVTLLILTGNTDATSESVHNAQHVFNAIQSSMRQWGSSLNHNGMSFFLATVPQGVQSHHGSPSETRIEGMEWLAFEPEHAIRFAWNMTHCDDPDATIQDQRSMKWSSPHDLSEKIESVTGEGDAQRTFKPSPPRPRPPFCFEPGYFHTYATNRALNLLYIDGESAGKTSNGTLDSQDYVLLHDVPAFRLSDDFFRAQNLCGLARTTWQNKIDGFIRMEHGFEMILCNFSSNLDVVSILAADQLKSEPFKTVIEKAAGEQFRLFSALSSRYFGIGGDRVKVFYDHFVTAYTYLDLDLFSTTGNLQPRLKSISNTTARQIFADVTSLILSSANPTSLHAEAINWQSITTLLTTRYARPLKLMGTPNSYPNTTAMRYALALLYSPYISSTSHNTTTEIHRCSTTFLPYHLSTLASSNQSLSQRAFLTVSNRVCTSIHTILSDTNLTLHEQQAIISELVSWLAWPEFKLCEPACPMDEICFTAIWPWGGVEDIEVPSCKNGREIVESMGNGWGWGW